MNECRCLFLRELNAHHSGIHGASDDHQVRPESTRIHLHVTGFSLYGIIVLRKGIRIKLILIVPGILFVVFTSRAICLRDKIMQEERTE